MWLSNTAPTVGHQLDGTTIVLCRQFVGRVEASHSAYVTCEASSSTFRYVIIQSSQAGPAVCLVEVQVYIGLYINSVVINYHVQARQR